MSPSYYVKNTALIKQILCCTVLQMRQVRESLDALWCFGEVVLFTWINFLQNELIDTLAVTSPLSVGADAFTAIIDHNSAVNKQVIM